jgi:hypothetical protein
MDALNAAFKHEIWKIAQVACFAFGIAAYGGVSDAMSQS